MVTSLCVYMTPASDGLLHSLRLILASLKPFFFFRSTNCLRRESHAPIVWGEFCFYEIFIGAIMEENCPCQSAGVRSIHSGVSQGLLYIAFEQVHVVSRTQMRSCYVGRGLWGSEKTDKKYIEKETFQHPTVEIALFLCLYLIQFSESTQRP